jgi:prepilin signal peptidase PulO-like enzyme (type II secretory pathway)
MNQTSVGILVLHLCILVIQLVLMRVYPNLKRALPGVYFVLLPAGFQFFMPPPPALAAAMALAGLLWIFHWAGRAPAPSGSGG